MATETLQTITRLTPLADVLALVSAQVTPVAPRRLSIGAAAGRVLAADAMAATLPEHAIALQDGWALAADLTLGAGSYAPALLRDIPARIEAGQAMPAGTDSVAPFDAIQVTQGRAEAVQPVNPGDGVLPAGADTDAAVPLRRAGERLRLTDCAALAAAGLADVAVREPHIIVAPLRNDGIVDAAARLIAVDIARAGGLAQVADRGTGLTEALTAQTADAVIAVGGTGNGRNDDSVHVLAREGRLALHGMALTPGETAAFGFAGARPVLLLPGRLDAALCVWLTVGRPMLRRLAGADEEREPAETVPLARKITSTVGLTELVPVRVQGGQAEPLAGKYLPLSALARSSGWVLVPAGSEGYSAGSTVQVRPWP